GKAVRLWTGICRRVVGASGAALRDVEVSIGAERQPARVVEPRGEDRHMRRFRWLALPVAVTGAALGGRAGGCYERNGECNGECCPSHSDTSPFCLPAHAIRGRSAAG